MKPFDYDFEILNSKETELLFEVLSSNLSCSKYCSKFTYLKLSLYFLAY